MGSISRVEDQNNELEEQIFDANKKMQEAKITANNDYDYDAEYDGLQKSEDPYAEGEEFLPDEDELKAQVAAEQESANDSSDSSSNKTIEEEVAEEQAEAKKVEQATKEAFKREQNFRNFMNDPNKTPKEKADAILNYRTQAYQELQDKVFNTLSKDVNATEQFRIAFEGKWISNDLMDKMKALDQREGELYARIKEAKISELENYAAYVEASTIKNDPNAYDDYIKKLSQPGVVSRINNNIDNNINTDKNKQVQVEAESLNRSIKKQIRFADVMHNVGRGLKSSAFVKFLSDALNRGKHVLSMSQKAEIDAMKDNAEEKAMAEEADRKEHPEDYDGKANNEDMIKNLKAEMHEAKKEDPDVIKIEEELEYTGKSHDEEDEEEKKEEEQPKQSRLGRALTAVASAVGIKIAANAIKEATDEAEKPAEATDEAEKSVEVTGEAEKLAETTDEAEKPAETTNEAEKPAEAIDEAEKPAEAIDEAEKPAEADAKAEYDFVEEYKNMPHTGKGEYTRADGSIKLSYSGLMTFAAITANEKDLNKREAMTDMLGKMIGTAYESGYFKANPGKDSIDYTALGEKYLDDKKDTFNALKDCIESSHNDNPFEGTADIRQSKAEKVVDVYRILKENPDKTFDLMFGGKVTKEAVLDTVKQQMQDQLTDKADADQVEKNDIQLS